LQKQTIKTYQSWHEPCDGGHH
jgi:hypothetical protein